MEVTAKLVSQIFSTILWAALSIAMIAMGSIYINNCAIEKNIPIYLIVAGVTKLVMFGVWPLMTVAPKVTYGILAVLSSFTLAWFIAGSVWVFRNYQTKPRDCNDSLYNFAFGILIFSYAYAAIAVVYLCLGACCKICLSRSE